MSQAVLRQTGQAEQGQGAHYRGQCVRSHSDVRMLEFQEQWGVARAQPGEVGKEMKQGQIMMCGHLAEEYWPRNHF